MFLQIKNLDFSYDSRQNVLKNISLSLADHEIGVLLGRSGCGKTSLLRCIAGFERPSSGEIVLDQKILFSSKQSVPPQERGIGYLFQHLALFPHMTVEKNISYGIDHWQKDKRIERLHEVLEFIGLGRYRIKYPHELSGGEKQRVALARALAPKPHLLLMDEPFSSLDYGLRKAMRLDLRRTLKDLGITALIVTHDHEEAYELADRVGVMDAGVLVKEGVKEDLFRSETKQIPVLQM